MRTIYMKHPLAPLAYIAFNFICDTGWYFTQYFF